MTFLFQTYLPVTIRWMVLYAVNKKSEVECVEMLRTVCLFKLRGRVIYSS